MRKALIAAALAVLGATGAEAADLPARVYSKAPSAVVAPGWAGFYLGPTLGWSFGSAKGDYTGAPPPPAAIVSYPFDLKPNGVTLGGLLGYNFQFGRWVTGLEGDLSWVGNARDRIWDPGGSARYDEVELLWTGHIRGRVGYLVDQYLIFATGGAAFAGTKASHFGPVTGGSQIWSEDTVRTGYSVGGGLERAFTNNWNFRIEYLYDHFDSKHYDWIPNTRYSNSDLTTNTVRVSFVYRPL